MVVDRGWAIRNLGFDPIASPPPAATFALAEAAARPSLENLQREIIEFDSEAPHGREFLAYTTATGLSRFTEIGWPKRLAPRTTPTLKGRSDSPLPQADVLVVTWTVDEGHATSRVLTPGKDSRNDYRPYTHNYASISSRMVGRCPARQLKRLGTYWTATIAKKPVLVFKSDSHMSQDGPQLPNIDVWRQIISEVRPKLVLTTGTAGGIGKQFEVGDVVVSPTVRFDCKKKFKSRPFHDAGYWSVPARTRSFAAARRLFKANAAQLPKENARLPKIFTAAPGALPRSVVTTDFFGFDTSNDYYGLQGLGYVSEMGDAVLGLVCQELGAQAPRYVAVRNVSDPQISAAGMTLREQARLAAQIYKAFGRWSTVCSAIACWALIVAD